MSRKGYLSILLIVVGLLLLGNGPQPEVTPEPTLETVVEVTPEATLAAVVEVTAEATPEATFEATVEAAPEVTAQPTPDFPGPGSYTVREMIDDLERSYRIYIPTAYTDTGAPAALIFVLHGAGGNGAGIEAYSGFDDLADQENFIVVYPDGVNNVWNDGRRGDPRVTTVDDVAYISRVLDFLTGALNIDPNRVYATGHSMGGMLAYRLGCELGDKLAAVASVASTLPEYLLAECAPADPIPVLVIQGTDDNVIPWTGVPRNGDGYFSAANTMYFWSLHNLCDQTPDITALPDLAPNDGTLVLVERYNECQNEAEILLYGVYHGGHTWPGHVIGVSLDIGLTSMDIDATEVIWDFFQRHSR